MPFEPLPKAFPWDPPHEHPKTVEDIQSNLDAVNLAMAHALIQPEQCWQLRQGYAQAMRMIYAPATDRLERLADSLEKKMSDPAVTGREAAAIAKQLRGITKDISQVVKP